MAYQVLARKYRPQRFADVAGQEHVTRTLLNALAQGRIAHGYIFSGHRGIGKTTVARILAMALNCQHLIGSPERPTSEPCGICDSCAEIRSGSAVDVIEIDAATNRGIDEIRELRDAARYRPARDRYKIYILDEAHQITDAAFNALLKTLEEPPEHVVFMMATTQPEDIPQTIRSRSQHFSFHAVRYDDILSELRAIAEKESIAFDDSALGLLAEAGDGSMRDALSIMDQAIASAPVEADGKPHLDATQVRELMGTVPNTVFERLLESISENASAAVMEEANRLLAAGNSPSQLARQFVRYLRNALMARLDGEATELLQISADERARAARTAMLFSEEDLTRFLQVMLRTFDELNYRQEPRFHLELGLLKLVHMQRLIPLEQLMSQLPAGGSRPAATAPSRPAIGATGTRHAVPERSPAATPGVSGGQAPAAERPAFSPFEADSRRKRSDAPEGRSEPRAATAAVVVDDAVRSESPAVLSAAAVAEMPSVLRREPQEPQPNGHMSPEDERREVEIEEEIDSSSAPSSEVPSLPEVAASGASPSQAQASELDTWRNAVATALDERGHNTAAALLTAGQWSVDGDTITVVVAVKKMMLGLTMNPEAERIAKKALLDAGCTWKLSVLPGERGPGERGPGERGPGERGPGERGPGDAGATATKRPAAAGSIQAQALENPLVRQAQDLFRAEVRSVLDLRDKDLRDKR